MNNETMPKYREENIRQYDLGEKRSLLHDDSQVIEICSHSALDLGDKQILEIENLHNEIIEDRNNFARYDREQDLDESLDLVESQLNSWGISKYSAKIYIESRRKPLFIEPMYMSLCIDEDYKSDILSLKGKRSNKNRAQNNIKNTCSKTELYLNSYF